MFIIESNKMIFEHSLSARLSQAFFEVALIFEDMVTVFTAANDIIWSVEIVEIRRVQ